MKIITNISKSVFQSRYRSILIDTGDYGVARLEITYGWTNADGELVLSGPGAPTTLKVTSLTIFQIAQDSIAAQSIVLNDFDGLCRIRDELCKYLGLPAEAEDRIENLCEIISKATKAEPL